MERQKRAAEAAERLKQEEEEWAKVNEKRKADGKEELTLENWRKEEKGALSPFRSKNNESRALFVVLAGSTRCRHEAWHFGCRDITGYGV